MAEKQSQTGRPAQKSSGRSAQQRPQSAEAQKKRDKLRKKRRRMKILLTTLFTLLALFVIFLIVLFASGVGGKIIALYKDAKKLVEESTEETFRASETSLIYDVNGNQILSASGEKDVKYLSFEEIPPEVKNAFIDVEDKSFYSHHGYSLKAIARAVQSIIKNGEITQGGSTITQQLARNIFLSFEVSWERKVEEIFIASRLEKKYTKEQILEFYINNIYFANGYYGIEAAAQGYFSCSASELDLSHLVFLCAIPNNPTLYDPEENPDNTIKRRDRMLEAMLEEEDISQAQYDEAVAETITLVQDDEAKTDNSVETYVFYCATRALMEESGFEFRYSFTTDSAQEVYDEEYQELYVTCQKALYTNGYRIYTSIDMDQQELLQQALDETLRDFDETDEDGIYTFQGAATCIDNVTGYVTAIVGGRDQNLSGRALNRAYQSFRQPGSSIKPLIVYTPALEQGYTPDTIVDDHYIEDGPSNSDGSYDGEMSLRWAVAQSKNTIAWQVFEEVTPKVGLQYLKEMNFSKISQKDETLSSALGGLTNGVSTVEMASAYATIANKGEYRAPTCIMKILDAEGQKVLSTKTEEKRVYDSNAALMMTSMMETVMSDGTGRSLKLEDMPCAGKTGTTNDNKDGWFCGFTPYYTTAVWVGYDMPKALSELQGASYPGEIWRTFMAEINEGLPYKEFEEYEEPEDESDAEEIDWTEEPTEKPEETQTPEPVETATPEPTQTPEPEPTEAPATPEPTEAPVEPEPTEPPTEPTEAPVEPQPTEAPAEPQPTEDLGDDNDDMDWDEIP